MDVKEEEFGDESGRLRLRGLAIDCSVLGCVDVGSRGAASGKLLMRAGGAAAREPCSDAMGALKAPCIQLLDVGLDLWMRWISIRQICRESKVNTSLSGCFVTDLSELAAGNDQARRSNGRTQCDGRLGFVSKLQFRIAI